jgi:amino-acid N-acetyltransferase
VDQVVHDAAAADLAVVYRLLEQEGLPTSDLPSSRARFIVLVNAGVIVAAGALERFGSAALLRSVVVAGDRRGAGLGRRIVEELESRAGAAGIDLLILLTQTARGFFAGQGYRVIERIDAPADVRGSAEFRSLCPSTAICMIKLLTGPE